MTAELDAALRSSELARARFATTANELRERASPARVLNDTMDGTTTKVVALLEGAERVAMRRPKATAYIGGAILLLLVRKPVGRVWRGLFGRQARNVDDDLH